MSTLMRREENLDNEWINDLLRQPTPEQQQSILEALDWCIQQESSKPIRQGSNAAIAKLPRLETQFPEKSAPERSA